MIVNYQQGGIRVGIELVDDVLIHANGVLVLLLRHIHVREIDPHIGNIARGLSNLHQTDCITITSAAAASHTPSIRNRVRRPACHHRNTINHCTYLHKRSFGIHITGALGQYHTETIGRVHIVRVSLQNMSENLNRSLQLAGAQNKMKYKKIKQISGRLGRRSVRHAAQHDTLKDNRIPATPVGSHLSQRDVPPA